MLQELKSQHKEMARMTLEGYSSFDIAEKLDMHPGSIQQIKRDPLFKQMLGKLEDKADEEVVDVRKKISELSIKAVEKMDGLIDSYDDKVSLNASKDILDRAGYKPVEKSENLSATVHLTKDEIEELKGRAKKSGAMVSEAEYKEIDDTHYGSRKDLAPSTDYLGAEPA